jgi:hypothetical protein
MKKIIISFLFLSTFLIPLLAQNDDEIVSMAEKMPRFPACERTTLSEKAKDSCAQAKLLEFVYRNVRYPQEARSKDIQGTVYARFVVERDGLISSASVLKDIGGGCGAEVVRVLNLMDSVQIRWIPGMTEGKTKRVAISIPVKFKLQEELPYQLLGRDTVYTHFDKELSFMGGATALEQSISKSIKVPKEVTDSCRAGVIQVSLLVHPKYGVKILETSDYSDLGFDAQFEAIQAANQTVEKWDFATYKKIPVPAMYPIRMIFKPDAKRCPTAEATFNQAFTLAQEATTLAEANQRKEAAGKLTEALVLSPNNAEFLYARGMLYLDIKENDAACKDLRQVKQQLKVSWNDAILKLLCK